jgi:Phosphotransferase enzyme family
VERIGALREPLTRVKTWRGELPPGDVLPLVDTVMRNPEGHQLLRGNYNAGIVVDGKVLRFRQRPHDRRGQELHPADTAAALRKFGIPSPQLLFAADLDLDHTLFEVYEFVDNATDLRRRFGGQSASLQGMRGHEEPLPPKVVQQGADLLARLAVNDPPEEFRDRYPQVPSTLGEAHAKVVGHILEHKDAQWERFGDAFEAIGLRRDVGEGTRSRFEHPAPDLPARIVHGGMSRANFLLTGDNLLMPVDVDGAHFGDPADDAYHFMTWVVRSQEDKQDFVRRYEEGIHKVDSRMAERLGERIELYERLRSYELLMSKMPNWTVLEMSWARPEMKEETRLWLAAIAEDKLIRCQPVLGNNVVSGERLVDTILASGAGGRAGST